MDGTANNYMAGSLGIGSTSLTGYNLRVSKNITGLTNAFNTSIEGTVQSDVTSAAVGLNVSLGTVAAISLNQLRHVSISQGSFGGGSAVTNQYGIYVDQITSATNNYGFYGAIASGTNRWNLYMNGTAANYMAGVLNIGTTTLSGYTLDVNGTGRFTGNVTSNVQFISNNGTVETRLSYSSTPAGVVGTISNHPLEFYTNSNAKMTLSTSGNLGLGVTPSAWGSRFRAIQLQDANIFTFLDNSALQFTSNAFHNGSNFIYQKTAAATYYTMTSSGQHQWYTAPSGTAGNAITFTQAMTLFANGNLAVGTTTDSGYKLDVNGTGRFSGMITSSTGNSTRLFTTSGATTGYLYADILNTGGRLVMGVESSVGATLGTGYDIYAAVIASNTTANLNFGTNGIKRLTIDGSTGAATFSSSVTSQVTANAAFLATSGTTSRIYSQWANTGGNAFFGIESSTGGNLFTGSSAYATVLGTDAARSLEFATNNNIRLSIASTGAATFSSTLGIGGVADSVKSGTYTPTINTTTNIASSSVGTWQYLRVGNTVTVSGSITITPTAGVSTTSFNFSLPINSTFATGNDCAGTGVDYNATTYLMVNGNSGAANFGLGLFKSTTTSAMTLSIQFTYQII